MLRRAIGLQLLASAKSRLPALGIKIVFPIFQYLGTCPYFRISENNLDKIVPSGSAPSSSLYDILSFPGHDFFCFPFFRIATISDGYGVVNSKTEEALVTFGLFAQSIGRGSSLSLE